MRKNKNILKIKRKHFIENHHISSLFYFLFVYSILYIKYWNNENESHIVEEVVHSWHSFDSIESIELEIPTIEIFSEITIAREVFLLDLEISWSTAAVIHVIGPVNSRPDIETGLRVNWVSLGDMELRLFLIAWVLRMCIHSLLFESLSYDLALDEPLRSFEVGECPYDFRISGHYIFLEIDVFRSQIVLHPRWSVFLVGGVVETALGCLCEGTLSWHLLFITYKYAIILLYVGPHPGKSSKN